jgi:glucose-1-phosphatase
MAEVEAVIFDLGRVLVTVDLDRGYWPELLRTGGGHPGDIASLKDNDLLVAFDCGHLTPAQFHEAVCRRAGLATGFVEFAARWCDCFGPVPGMDLLVEDVVARLPTAILSDTDPLHFPFCRRRFPAVGRIPRWAVSYEVGAMKPDPALFAAACDAVGVPPARCLFVDDLERNVEGAVLFGMQAVRFLDAEDLRVELQARGVLPEPRGASDSWNGVP